MESYDKQTVFYVLLGISLLLTRTPVIGKYFRVVNTMSENTENHFLTKKEAIKGQEASHSCGGGCPGSKAVDFKIDLKKVEEAGGSNNPPAPSELRQWPVQLHLLNPMASYFKNADVVLAADCTAFAMGNFHDACLQEKLSRFLS